MTCEWCNREFERPAKKGPSPKYCKPSCRQRAFEARQLRKVIAVAEQDPQAAVDEMRSWLSRLEGQA